MSTETGITPSANAVFNLPDLGEGLQDAEIVAWNISVGDHVVADQPLLSVETDKAVVEIPSPRSGRIARLFAEPGERVEVDGPLVEFEAGEASDKGAVVGDVPKEAPAMTTDDAGQEVKGTQQGALKAVPAIRALAAKLGVDLSIVQATGANNTITKTDVERAARTLAEAGPVEELRGVRRAMARNMARSGAEVVPASVTEEADIDAWDADEDITIRLVRAIAVAAAAEPALNAWYDTKAGGRRLHKRIDLGIATDTDDGLFVPVLRDVGNREADDLRRGLDKMRHDVEARTVPAAELRGQTISLSNFGMMAGLHGSLVVVPPQVAIVGAGRIGERVVAHEGAPAVRRMMPLSLTFDHRIVTGGEASRFLAALIEDLQQPR